MSHGFMEADWPAPANIRTLFTLRSVADDRGEIQSFNLGLTTGDAREVVMERRAQLARWVGHPINWIGQVHGTRVARLDAQDPAERVGPADAVWTATSAQPCLMMVADCLPVCFARRDGSAVGVAHAGWRGLVAGVLEATVTAMQQDRPEGGAGLIAWMGPCIGPENFEVGPEVRAAFVAADPGAGLAFRSRGAGKYLCDLPALARRRLAAAGVTAVFGGEDCTYADADRFFSHRRFTHDGTTTGRMAAVIWMEPKAS